MGRGVAALLGRFHTKTCPILSRERVGHLFVHMRNGPGDSCSHSPVHNRPAPVSEEIDFSTLDAAPNAEVIASLRDQAADRGESVGVTFPADGDTKRFVVSPRGTCVLLNDTREDTFNRSVAAEKIAAALQE